MPFDWHTRREKDLIERFGGEPQEKFGTDGTLDGAPVEVRSADEETRFRLNQDTHETMMERDGTYLFDDVDDGEPPELMSAGEAENMLDDDWHSDRGYMHQFLDVDNVFDR